MVEILRGVIHLNFDGKTKLDFPTIDDIRQKYPELIKDYNLNTDDEIRSFYNTTFPRNNNTIRDQFKEVLPDVDFLSFNEGSLKPQVTPFHKARIKSAVGNNGMFNMTNPNIYKALVPATAGVGVLSQQETPKKGFKNGGRIESDWEIIN